MNGWNFDLRTLDWQTSQNWIWILYLYRFSSPPKKNSTEGSPQAESIWYKYLPGSEVSVEPQRFGDQSHTTCLVLQLHQVFPPGTFSVPASPLLSQRSKKQYLLRLCAFTPNKSLFQMSVLPHSALPFCRWLERIKRFWWSCKWPSSCSVDATSYLEIPVFGAYSTECAHLVAV